MYGMCARFRCFLIDKAGCFVGEELFLFFKEAPTNDDVFVANDKIVVIV